MPHPAAGAEIYSHRECKGSTVSTLNGVSGFSFQNHGLLSVENDGKGLPACCFGLSSPAMCVPWWGWTLVGAGGTII